MENSPYIIQYIDSTRNSRRAYIDNVSSIEEAIYKFKQTTSYLHINSITYRGMTMHF